MDIVATAQGKIIPSVRVKVIQPLETGVIRAIHVGEGETVREGEVLIELDPTGAEADRERLGQGRATANLEAARLEALLTDDPVAAFQPPPASPESLVTLHLAVLVSQVQEHRARRAQLDGEQASREAEVRTIQAGIARLERMLPKVRERVEGRRELVEKQYMPRLRFAEMEEELFDLEGQLDVERQRLGESKAALSNAVRGKRQMEAEFRRDVLAHLVQARQRADSIEQEVIKAEERSRRQTLSAPVDGVVQQLAVHTVGGVVTPAQELMTIVPADSRLEIEAMVLNKDIGFVHRGQETEIKVESFPFTKYGTIDGWVTQVSADSVLDEGAGLVYPARIAMARTTMQVGERHVNLSPGMAVTIEIKIGKRRVIEYLLAPLQRYQSESMKER